MEGVTTGRKTSRKCEELIEIPEADSMSVLFLFTKKFIWGFKTIAGLFGVLKQLLIWYNKSCLKLGGLPWDIL